MSNICQSAAAHDAREARQLARTARAALAGAASRDPVLRHTIDYLSKEALRPRLMGNERFENECDCQDAMLATIDRMQADSLAAGPQRYRGDYSPAGVRIAQELVRDMKKNRNGRSDILLADAGCCGHAERGYSHGSLPRSGCVRRDRLHLPIDADRRTKGVRRAAAYADQRGMLLYAASVVGRISRLLRNRADETAGETCPVRTASTGSI